MNSIEQIIIKEQDFTSTMASKVLPFINDKIKDGYFTNRDGMDLHYQALICPDEKASIVISHGYCEFTTKFYETIYYFYQMGYSVFIIDHRGHGLSERQVQGYCMVHVDSFYDYIYDFNEFIEKVVRGMSPTEHLILFGHSMGGAIAALYLEMFPGVFEKAILSSPMIKLDTGNVNRLVIAGLKLLSHTPLFGKRYLPGQHDYEHIFKYPRCSAMSKARYTYAYNEREKNNHYRTSGCSYSWMREAFNVYKKIIKNANSVEIPVILMQASLDTLVVPEAQNEFASLAQNCQLVRFEGCKHEIFNATDDIILEYYVKLFDFLES
ncbi:MAG: lysophospholipase [Pseudobutyrivibrio sp.]|nr:lysophospholipase [Pseudobutyrivibrio sp.]